MTSSTVNPLFGLDDASSMAATANGQFAYVVGASEAKLQRFSRNAVTEALTPSSPTHHVRTGRRHQCAARRGEQLSYAPVATTSGLYLYALSPNEAMSIFSIDASTGDLTLADSDPTTAIRPSDHLSAAQRGDRLVRSAPMELTDLHLQLRAPALRRHDPDLERVTGPRGDFACGGS